MQRYKSVVTLGLLLLIVFLFTAPAFAEHPWADGRGKGKNAEDVLDGHPWTEDRGNGKNAEDLLDEYPWIDGRGKGKNAEDVLDAHPWIDGRGKGRGAAEGIDWTTYLRSCLSWLYR